MIDYPIWRDIGEVLKTSTYSKRYITPEQYLADNPLESLTVIPGLPGFFGTQVLNIFIVAIPFGWEKDGDGIWQDNWPPNDLNNAKARHIESYNNFSSYKTIIFMDFNIVNQIMAENPESRIQEMMDAVKGHMEELCTELAEYGFEMGADITGTVDAEFFQPYIDEFYGIVRD